MPNYESDYESDLETLLGDAIDDSVQDVYGEYRQAIGDYKMDAHRWEDRPERHEGYAAWLMALAARVKSAVARKAP